MGADRQKKAAEEFAEYWSGRAVAGGNEKSDSQSFWLSLLRDVFGLEHPEQHIDFETKVRLSHASYMDAYIPETKVLIEQKAPGKDLNAPIKQSDGAVLTPFQQAKRYITELPLSMHPRWVVTCNFEEFYVYDMEKPGGEPEVIELQALGKEYWRLQFLVDKRDETIKRELEVSVAAGDIVGLLYDALSSQYADPSSEKAQRSLNVLCVRLVFCLYAEDAGIFGKHTMFHDYLASFETRGMRRALVALFKILDTKPEERDPYLADDNPDLAAFPYVNGGLFADEDVEIPPFTEEIRTLLLVNASENFDWSEISPTIFGAVFESTLNPKTRRSGGMHYTSIENIHKVIDPLFLNDLKEELEEILKIQAYNTKIKKLKAFQEKLGSLTFLDPACGSGNFLTETYLSLRRLENKVIGELQQGQMMFGMCEEDVIRVSISQFYGIEINDFACTVAKTALWIAESQMMEETQELVLMDLEFLPLKTNANIVEGNALRMEWERVVPRERLNFIMGNPPFVGYSLQSKEQKADILSIYVDESGKKYKTAGKNDYVSGWFFKAAQMMAGTGIRTAFVSTNSITQGEQTANVWKPLYDRFGVHMDFAHRSFKWESEANQKAQVWCVITGFSAAGNDKDKIIYDGNSVVKAGNINAYLVDGPDVFVKSRNKPLCDVPIIHRGNQPTDGGNLIIEEDEYKDFIKQEPAAKKYIKRYMMGEEFINNKKRYCLWLVGASPKDIRTMPNVMKRVEAVKAVREKSSFEQTRKMANTPSLFREQFNPENFIAIPKVSSNNRRYVPMGYLTSDVIIGDMLFMIENATTYHFGILTSNTHMAWMRAVCGRLGTGYRYSKDIVYNNFPWPSPTASQRRKIEQTAQAILDVRAKYPDCSLADLYDELIMPPDLRKAHQENDRAVMEAYGWKRGDAAWEDESACVAELMKMYRNLTEEKE